MSKVADISKRRISAEIMAEVVKFLPRDGFKLSDDMLNKTYTVTDVNEVDFNGTKSFVVTAESEEGTIINLSAAILKKARVLGTADATGSMYKDNKNILVRSDADAIWNSSVYAHTAGMKKDEDFVIPEQFKLRYAVLHEDQETNEPALNPFLYKGFRKVVTEYQKNDEFPTIDDFKEELLKTVADGRIPGLHPAITVPTPQSWVKGDVSDYRHTLILEDFEN